MGREIIKRVPQNLSQSDEQTFLTWRRKNHLFTLSKEKLAVKAAQSGNIEITKYLLSKGYGEKEFVTAAEKGNIIAVKTFIAAGIDLETTTLFKNTALILAAYGQQPSIVRLLIEAGAHIKALNNGGRTALIQANDPESAALLIKAGANLYVRDSQDRTAKDWASHLDQHSIKILLQKAMEENPEEKSKLRPLKSKNKWSVSSDQEKEKVFHLTYDSETKTRMKYIFDFNAQILFTEIKSGDEPSNLLQKDFSAVNSSLLEKAEQVRKTPPERRPARLKQE